MSNGDPAGRVVGSGPDWLKSVASTTAVVVGTVALCALAYRLIDVVLLLFIGIATSAALQPLHMGRRDDCSADAKTEASLPHHVIFDRVYVHGTPTGNVRRGILANAAWVGLVDSYISDIHEVGADTQAFGAWNGTGPYLIRNNYLEAGAENIMTFGNRW